jgi:hypothetical protein
MTIEGYKCGMTPAPGAALKPWSALQPGDRFRVRSRSGNEYEVTFLAPGQEDAGLYVRLQGQKLARLAPHRLDWQTLEVLQKEDPVIRGDEVLVTPLGGEERRGRILEPPDDRMVISGQRGDHLSLPLDLLAQDGFFVLFAAQDLRTGDDFLVMSVSSREYRGHVTGVDDTHISCRLLPGTQQVSMRMENLDMESLRVLVPMPLSLFHRFPAAA